MRKHQLIRLTVASLLVGLTTQIGYAVTLPDPFTLVDKGVFGQQAVAVRYADFYSYSLPVLAQLYDVPFINSEFEVQSSPGQLKDDLVILTGAGGQAPNNQGRLFDDNAVVDNAYATPNGVAGSPSFSTLNTDDTSPTALTGVGDPDGAGEFAGDHSDSWDIQLSALHSFLTVDEERSKLVFYFNHNEDNGADDQDLFAFAQVSLRDSTGVLDALYFDFTGEAQIPQIHGGVDQYTNVVGQITPTFPDDFVLAAGQLVSPFGVINHNLGSDRATYAVYAPELDAFLDVDGFGGYDTMSVIIRLNEIDNGYEQLFIRRTFVEEGDDIVTIVPEPATATLSLLGLGILIVGLTRRRTRRHA